MLKKDARMRFRIGTAFFVGMACLAVAPLAAEQPSADQLKAADAARVAYENSGTAAATAVEDDGLMSMAELAQAGLIDLVPVAGGVFNMGNLTFGPIHAVTVSSFQIGRTEITQA